MNTKRILKVKVNGEKYLITGLQKAASYKDLLCSLAKVTTANTEVKKNDYTNKSYAGKEIVESNLQDRFKKDRETVGDYASLKVLNSLGKNAKIIGKTIEKTSSQRKTENREKNRRDKKVCEKKSRKVTSNLESKDLNKKKKSKLSHTANNEKRKENRCLDDSDIDSYRGKSLCRLKRHHSRVFDDSDLEVYKSLFNVVIDQTKKINKQNQQSKILRRNQWIKELYRTSQVYYIDDEKSDKGYLEKEQDNDSGLPTPEYDSSDTTENQIFDSLETKKVQSITSENLTEKCHEEYMKILLETNACLQKLNEKDTTTLPEKQINFQIDDKIERTLPNDKCNITPNDIKSLNTEISQQNATRKNSNTADGKIITLEKKIKETLTNKVEQLEKFDKLLTIENNSFTKESFKNDIIGETLSLGCNENIISPTTTINSEEISYKEDGEGTKPTMVAFEAVLSKKSLVENKKLDKKKVNKIDISGPVLLSPSTFKKHKKLLDVKRTVEINDGILRNAVTNNTEVEHKDRNINDKEKRNLFNKKIKEIKRKKKPKSKDNSENITHENNKEQDICSDTNVNSENIKENADGEKNGGRNLQTDEYIHNNHENSQESNKNLNKDPTPQNNESIDELYKENNDESTLENDLQLETNILSVPSQTLADLSFESDITLELSAREELLKQYIEEKKALDEIVIQIIECNLKVAEISDELNKYTDDNECETKSLSSVDTDISSDSKDQMEEEEYNNIYSELEGVQILLKSVTEITGQQRKEMSANLAVLDKLDIEVKTKKAAVANMNVGTFTDNSIAAPRSLIKYTKDKRKPIDPSCFV